MLESLPLIGPLLHARKRKQAAGLQSEGNTLLAAGDLAGAEQRYRRALKVQLDAPGIRVALAYVLMQQQRHAQAREELELVAHTDPNDADCHYLLGELAEGDAHFTQAAGHFQRAFELRPGFELACRDACRTLFLCGRAAECQALITAGLALNPLNADFHFYQGNLHLHAKQPELALQAYRQALSLGADHAALHAYAGRLLQQKGELEPALAHMTRALVLDPDIAEAHHGIGIIRYYYGQLEQAISDQRRAIELEPGLMQAHTALLFSLSFDPRCSPKHYLAQARQFGAAASAAAVPALPDQGWNAAARTDRPLRVGFVSGDLKFHPVASFLEAVLRHLDDASLHLLAFSNNPQDDEVTQRLRTLLPDWHSIWGLSDFEAAALIRRQQVDVLVDLAGHTSYTRLPVFAWRPALTQVSWMGYFASTGLAQMDYFLADPHSAPSQSHTHFCERVWYLPETRLCMTAPDVAGKPVSGLPALRNGYVTLGSFQALGKINDAVLSLWGRVMQALPQARLRLQTRSTYLAGMEERLLQRLEAAGIARGRVQLKPRVQFSSYLDAYAEVDFLLDSFPYPGGATTADALWMGVPTVTLMGNTLLARQGANLLEAAGLPDWVAHSPDDYVALAVRFASDLAGLSALRAGLRRWVAGSPLFDSRRFAAHFATALHAMHEDNLARHAAGDKASGSQLGEG